MEKRGTFRKHLQRSNKNLRFCIGPTAILSNRLLTLVQEGKINSKLYINTVTYIVNPEVLCATKKSLTSTPKTLDCETPVNSEQLVSPPSTPTVSTPNAVNKKAQESSFADSAHPFPLLDSIAVTPKNSEFHADFLALKDFFINEICVLRNKLISNKQHVD